MRYQLQKQNTKTLYDYIYEPKVDFYTKYVILMILNALQKFKILIFNKNAKQISYRKTMLFPRWYIL